MLQFAFQHAFTLDINVLIRGLMSVDSCKEGSLCIASCLQQLPHYWISKYRHEAVNFLIASRLSEVGNIWPSNRWNLEVESTECKCITYS